jgi:nitrite reductase (NO-forming)
MSNRSVNMVAIVIAAAALVVSIAMRVEGGPAAPAPPAAPAAGAEPTHAVEAARSLDVPNVVHDPADVPPPITRTEPTTVKITLTVEELVSELADGTTYMFWTFDGTVPGPMLRVMQGDTVELTLVNPATNLAAHNIDLHAVNGPGGGAAVTNVQPGESKTFTFTPLNAGVFV